MQHILFSHGPAAGKSIYRPLLFVLLSTGCLLFFTQPALAALPYQIWNFSGNGGFNNVHTITVPEDGLLDYKVTYDTANTLKEIEFQLPLTQCYPEDLGPHMQPNILYTKYHPVHDKLYDVNIPVGPGKVDIVVNAGSKEEEYSSYHLTVYYWELLAWQKDTEPNSIEGGCWDDLGTLATPASVFSHAWFSTCFYGGVPGILSCTDTTQSDSKDYFRFKVRDTGWHKLVHRRLQHKKEECIPYVSLIEKWGKDDQYGKYLYYKWDLREQDEIGTFLLREDRVYYLDLQLLCGCDGCTCYRPYCFTSVEIGIVPVDSPWLGIDHLSYPENTVCGVKETLQAFIRNDGDKDAEVYVDYRLYHPAFPEIVMKGTVEVNILAGEQLIPVDLPVLIPHEIKVATGEWVIEITVSNRWDSATMVTRKWNMGVVCNPPINVFIYLLLQGEQAEGSSDSKGPVEETVQEVLQ